MCVTEDDVIGFNANCLFSSFSRLCSLLKRDCNGEYSISYFPCIVFHPAV